MPDALLELADLHGVARGYEDVDGRWVPASAEAVLGALRALGVPIGQPDDAPSALGRWQREHWGRVVEPVSAGFGRSLEIELRLPADRATGTAALHLTLESGEEHTWTEELGWRAPRREAHVDGRRHLVLALPVVDLPHGYHRLAVEHDGRRDETLLIVAPERAWGAPFAQRMDEWGAMLPLHALRTARDRGVGDLTDLADLAAWLGELGASVVGTLPLLPVYLGGSGEPFDPSPYSPVSRLFWNELHLDLSRAPELDGAPRARELLGGADLERLRTARYVDHRAVGELTDGVLRALSERYFAEPGDRRGDLERFIARRPEVEHYALFRGAVARYGSRWWEWPPAHRDGELGLDDVDLDTARRHLYAQLLADEQVAELSRDLRQAGQHPYLDLPVGTRRDGFDVFAHRDVYVLDADTGAPPDTIFTGGQNWHVPPFHPERLRRSGYEHLIAVLRHHLRLADDLRVDHVMGFHRLFWIPDGIDTRDGVYVRYPAHEFHAILTLESHRHRSRIVGEDLGTVPDEVEDALREHGINRMFVVQYELHPDREPALPAVPDDVTASVNTHDMPPFARFWSGDDVADNVDLGLLDEAEAATEREKRAALIQRLVVALVDAGHLGPGRDAPGDVHAALLRWLGSSPAPVVLANLEDLWLEREPQNTPGTETERPNWRRRTTLTLGEARQRDDITGPLRRLDAARSARRGQDG